MDEPGYTSWIFYKQYYAAEHQGVVTLIAGRAERSALRRFGTLAATPDVLQHLRRYTLLGRLAAVRRGQLPSAIRLNWWEGGSGKAALYT